VVKFKFRKKVFSACAATFRSEFSDLTWTSTKDSSRLDKIYNKWADKKKLSVFNEPNTTLSAAKDLTIAPCYR